MAIINAPFLSGIVTLLAIVLYLYMGARVGILRGRLGIKAPATTGDPLFGLAFIAGWIVYMRLYMSEPERRIPGAFMAMLSNVGLIVLSVIGLIEAR